MSLFKNRSTSQFIKFSITGAIGTLIDFGVMNLLTMGLGWEKLTSQAISFCLAVINNFFLNRHWTFSKSRKLTFWQQLLRFSLISLAGLGIRTPLFWILSKSIAYLATPSVSSISTLEPEWIGNNIALAVCIIIVLLWNYFANRRWTFLSEEITDESK